jgi:diaminopimelate decarboxylase
MSDVEPNPWSVHSTLDRQRGLSVAGVAAPDLAAEYGTPLLVVDEDDFRERCRAFVAAFGRVLYAVKAFPAATLIRAATEEGLGLLVSTGGELQACLRAGVAAAPISFHGNNKSAYELEMALDAGVGLITVDNVDELEMLSRIAQRLGVVQDILLRIAPGVEGETHAYLETGGLESKFGIPEVGDRALSAMKLAETLPGVSLSGIHAHVGSQLTHVDPYLAEVERLFDLLAEVRDASGKTVGLVDLGGGFGVTYTDEQPVTPDDASGRILAAVDSAATARGLDRPEIMVEPGRALVANSVCTLYTAGFMKDPPSGASYIAVDGGMSDNIRPALYGARYTVACASPGRTGAPTRVTVVGKHCESGDVLATDVGLPEDLQAGDLLAFASTGAYGYSMASNYNHVGRPAVVAVRDGKARLILRREDDADLGRLEVDPRPEPDVSVPADVEIRPARPRDAASFDRMWRPLLEEGWVRSQPFDNPVRHYKALFRRSESSGGLWLMALADREVIGHLAITRETHPLTAHVATLGLGVAAPWRGKGVASALMAEAFRWARSVGVRKLILTVYPDNVAAVRLYRRFGFVDEGRFAGNAKDPQNPYGYRDEILMGRWLG